MPSKLEEDVMNILSEAKNFITKKLKEKNIKFEEQGFDNTIYIDQDKRSFFIDLKFQECEG